MEPRGAYPVDRAAALSGVPRSTVGYWASKEILVPSISAERTRLWSYSDLMALRVVYWLRRPKKARDGAEIPRTKMPAVRRTISQLRELDLELWTAEGGPQVAVDRDGKVVLDSKVVVSELDGQGVLDADLLPVLRPFATLEGTQGPDLQGDRAALRAPPEHLQEVAPGRAADLDSRREGCGTHGSVGPARARREEAARRSQGAIQGTPSER